MEGQRLPGRAVVEAFGRALSREAHVLSAHPELLWQQLHNRLQSCDSVVEEALRDERELRTKSGTCRWLRTRKRPGDSDDLIRVLGGPTDRVNACAMAPDGSFAASANADGTLRLWDWRSGGEVMRLRASGRYVPEGLAGLLTDSWRAGPRACAVSPDGRVAYADNEGGLRLFDPRRPAEQVMVGRHAGAVNACAFSPDASRLASAGNDKTLRVWVVTSGEQVACFEHRRAVTDCAFAPSGAELVSACLDRAVRVWDLEEARERLVLRGHTDCVQGCAVSPDGARVASASWDKTVRLWAARDGRELATLRGHTGSADTCSFSPDGGLLASGGRDKVLRVWDLETRRARAALRGHTSGITACRFSPDGSAVLSSSVDGTIRVWSTPNKDRVAEPSPDHEEGVAGCAFDPRGQMVASASRDATLKTWDVQTGECLNTALGHRGPVHACAFAPDGAVLISAGDDGTLRLWTADDLAPLGALEEPRGSPVYACAVSHDGAEIATGAKNGIVTVWDRDAGRRAGFLIGHSGAVFGCTYSGDDTHIVTAGEDTTLRIWDRGTRVCEAVLTGHSNWIIDCDVSFDASCIVSASADGNVRVWRPEPEAHLGMRGDRWELTSDMTLSGHAGTVYACSLLRDGTLAISAGTDHSLRIWDIRRGEQVGMLPLPGDGECLAVHPSRPVVACGERGGSVVLADLIGFGPSPAGEARQGVAA